MRSIETMISITAAFGGGGVLLWERREPRCLRAAVKMALSLHTIDAPSSDSDPRIRQRLHRPARSVETGILIAAGHDGCRAFRRGGGSRDRGWS